MESHVVHEVGTCTIRTCFIGRDGECGEGVSMKGSENGTLLENIRVHKRIHPKEFGADQIICNHFLKVVSTFPFSDGW